VKLAGEFGIHQTARTLRLDYVRLKKRVNANTHRGPSEESAPSFFELVSPGTNHLPECTVEVEDPHGAKLKIHLKGAVTPDLAALTKAFWRSEA
jgi:hypothetical protein